VSETVFLVEDEESPTDVYVDEMKERNLTVEWFRTADQALEAAESLHPSVIILDLVMPRGRKLAEHAGMETTGELLYAALHDKFRDVPVIIWTQYPGETAKPTFPRGLSIVVKQKTNPADFADLVKQTAQKGAPTNLS
jgi:CheY-like chemotaxis protein